MTKQEAKIIALKKLTFYKKQPLKYRQIGALPDYIFYAVARFHNKCPLCELFCTPNPEDGKHCGECPLTPPSCNDVRNKSLENNITILNAWKTEAI
jgi:hypothetical protein